MNNDDFEIGGEENGRKDNESRNSQSGNDRAESRRGADRPAQPSTRPATPTIASLNRLQPRPLLGNASDAVLQTIIDGLNLAIEKNADPTAPEVIQAKNWKFLPFDSQSNGVSLGSVIVSLLVPTQNGKRAFNFIMVVDRPGALSTREEEYRGRRYDAIRTPSDVVTEGYLNKVNNLLAQAYRVEENVFCGFFVIPHEAATTLSKDNLNGTTQVLAGAFDSVCSQFEAYSRQHDGSDYQPFSLTWFGRDDKLEIVPNMSGEPVVDAVGIPARADVLLQLAHTAPSDEDDGNVRTPLADISAMLTLDFVEPNGGKHAGFGRRRRNNDEEPFWQPIMTVTSITRRTAQFGLPQALLAMSSLAPLSDDFGWLDLLRPVEGQQDFRDIGMLPVLNPAGGEDAKAIKGINAGISDDKLRDYLADLVKEDLAFAIDIPDATENSWLLSIFSSVAAGNRDALAELTAAANDLTDGHFSDVMSRLDPDGRIPFSDSYSGHFLGWFTNGQGEIRDLRELDTLSVLTRAGEKNKDMALDWQDTFDHINVPQDLREADRMRIMERLVSGIRVVGRAQRFYIEPVFIRALAEAVALTKVRITMVNQRTGIAARAHGNVLAANFATRDVGRGMLTSRRSDRDRDDNRGRRSSLYDTTRYDR